MSIPAIYDETKVPAYTLPDPLRLADGTIVADPESWLHQRRPALLKLFAEQMYGQTPSQTIAMQAQVTDLETQALDGKATRKQVTLRFGDRGSQSGS